MGKLSRDRGRTFEQEVARAIREELGVDVHRNWQEQCAIKGKADIVIEGGDIISLECKRSRAATDAQIQSWWYETCEQATGSKIPVLAYRADRQSMKFVIPAGDPLAGLDSQWATHFDFTATIGIRMFGLWVREMM